MKTLLFGLFLCTTAALAQDCQWTETITSATTGASRANLNPQCVTWRISYYAVGMTALSIQFEGAPDVGGAPGAFVVAPNTGCSAIVQPPCLLDGTNPLTDPENQTVALRSYYAWVHVNVTVFTPTGATGSIIVRAYGYKGTSPAASVKGGGGGSAYATIENAGVPLTQRTIVNFSGAGITCVDNGGAIRTDCSVPEGPGVLLSGVMDPGVPVVPTVVQSLASPNNTLSITTPNPVVAGNLIAVYLGCASGLVATTMADNQLNVYTQQVQFASGNPTYGAWFTTIASAPGNITATWGGTCVASDMAIMEIHGATNTMDAFATSGGLTAPMVVTTLTSDIILVGSANPYNTGTLTVVAPTVLGDEDSPPTPHTAVGYLPTSIPGNYTPSWTWAPGFVPATISLAMTAIPVPTPGNNGDWYLNTTTGVLWGPKTGGVWSVYTGAELLTNGTGKPLSIFPYGAKCNGTHDDAAAINATIAALPAAGGDIYLCRGIIRFDSQILVNKRVTFWGSGNTEDNTATSPTVLLKHGNFTGILITAGSSKLRNLTVKGDTGNGGDGIQVAAPRVVLEDVSSINQAGVGVRVGVTAAHAIADLTEFRGLTVRGNTGDGLYMHDDDADGGIDANTATGNVFAEGNGGNGITLEKAQANRFTYWAEANTGYGVEVKAQVAAGKNELHGHAEGNGVGQVHFDSGSSENLVITPDVGTVVDLGTNQIWDGSGFVTRVPLTVHSTGVFTGTLGAAPGGTASAWKKYSLIKVANGVNGCAQPNGCFQVNGSSPGVTAPAAFSVAGILYTGSNFSLVENVAVVPAVACTGATTATLSVGSSNAGGTFYTAAYDIQTAPADIGRTQFTAPMKYFQKTAESATWTITTTISNVDQLIAGCQVDIYVKWSALP